MKKSIIAACGALVTLSLAGCIAVSDN